MSETTFLMFHVTSSVCYDVIRIGSYHVANIHKPPSENWVPQIPYLFFHTHHWWLEILIVTTLIGDTKNQTRMAKCSMIGRREMITI